MTSDEFYNTAILATLSAAMLALDVAVASNPMLPAMEPGLVERYRRLQEHVHEFYETLEADSEEG